MLEWADASETETAAWDLPSLALVRLFRCIVITEGFGTAQANGTRPEVVTALSSDLMILAGDSGVSSEPLEIILSGLASWGGESPVLSISGKLRCKALSLIWLITCRFVFCRVLADMREAPRDPPTIPEIPLDSYLGYLCLSAPTNS